MSEPVHPAQGGYVHLAYEPRNVPHPFTATLVRPVAEGEMQPHVHSRDPVAALVQLGELLAWEREEAEGAEEAGA